MSEAQQEWRQILCETNSTPQKISKIQSALLAAGFKPGRTDGVVTNETFVAINDYQNARNLPIDPGRYINIAAVKSLGVTPK